MMKKQILYTCLWGLLLFSFSGCKKTEVITDTPSIKVLSVTPNPAVKYQDEIKIKIEYTDGNGDLGENTPDVKNVFVTDSRNNITYSFRLSQLSPETGIIIRGNVTITLPPQGFIDDNNTSETVSYSIYVVDRAGNTSNVVETNPITVNL